MLIDQFLSTHDVGHRHQVRVDADSSRVYSVLRHVDLTRSWTVRVLFALRGLPWRHRLTLDDLLDRGFVLLAEEPDREILLGLTGRFWRLRGDIREVGADRFAAFAEPGYARAVWSFTVQALGEGRSLLSTETRVAATDASARRALRRYWRVVGPFSGLIRRRMLRQVKATAEAASQ